MLIDAQLAMRCMTYVFKRSHIGGGSVLPGRVLVNSMGREGQYTYKWPRPSVTVDTCIISAPQGGEGSKVLLIQRKHDPFAGSWALPGGFVDEGESLQAAAARELQEETSIDQSATSLTQVGAYGDPGRDPRGWTITVAYCAIVPSMDVGVKVRMLTSIDTSIPGAWSCQCP
jgi:ADP-ribose pyrophosphatase YjhB (NUDIX family)